MRRKARWASGERGSAPMQGGGGPAWRRLLPVGALLLAVRVGAQQPAQGESYRSNPDFVAEVAAARAAGTSAADQMAHWQRADAIAGGRCAECAERVATIGFRAGEWEKAIRAAKQFEARSTLPKDKAYAELLHGSAIFHLNDDQPTPNELSEADEALEAAIANDPTMRTALYLDGRALAALHRDEDARAAFTRYLQLAPAEDKYRQRAQMYLKNLRLARAAMAPPFAVTTMDGRKLTLDELQGRVVLLDFWATWCVPCRQFLPRLQKLNAEMAGRPFTLVSVSWDEDTDAWKTFVQENHMTWAQVLDADHALSNVYGVDALPHYFAIDADGALQAEVVGLGDDDLAGRVSALVDKAEREAHPRRKLDKVPAVVGR